jgi:exodeoxyribonuclease VII small subunit
MSEQQSFEEAIKRLEELVGKLEAGDVPLEDMLKLYEEGAQLIKFCLDKLDQAEMKIKKLSANHTSDFTLDALEE